MIRTQRLILRPWLKEDFGPFADLNADPHVMEYFPAILSREKSDQLARSISNNIEKRGWGLWAVSVINGPHFIGFIGLDEMTFEAPFTPAVEVGWRLAYDFWNQGYATEGAWAALQYGFEVLKLNEIISVAFQGNNRSRKVMEKLGMTHDPKDDFDHYKLPKGHPLQRHVLYRMNQRQWKIKSE